MFHAHIYVPIPLRFERSNRGCNRPMPCVLVYVCCFEFTFLLTKLHLFFHSQDSVTTSSANATVDILTKVDAASLNPLFTQNTGTENDVSTGKSVDGGTFVTIKIVLKLLLIWKYKNQTFSWIRKCRIEHCFLENSFGHRIGDVQSTSCGCMLLIWIYYLHLLGWNCVYYSL